MAVQEKESAAKEKTGVEDQVILKMADTKKEEEKGTQMMERQQINDKIYYGETEEVNPVRHADYNDYLKLAESKQQLPGFDGEYRDIVDYVLKITHRIWEEKGIGVIYDTYHNDVTMHCASTNLVGIKDVVANTLMTLHSFPDRRLIGEQVIWSKHDTKGYLSSHRVLSTATNLGDSDFGRATGKKVYFRTVIDCAIENNRIYEEWLVRDNLWLVKQLGFDVHEVAKNMARGAKGKTPALQSRYGLGESMEGQFFPEKYRAKDDSVGEMMLEMHSHVFNYKMINEIRTYYAKDAVTHYICGKDLVGYEEIQGMVISLLASFPNAHHSVDRITCNRRAGEDEWDVAVRWRLRGLHEGRGMFGAPSMKPVEMLGINHYRIAGNRIQEEWVTFDGLDVLKQIYLETDDAYIKTDDSMIEGER
jgi:predicted ester cyclase